MSRGARLRRALLSEPALFGWLAFGVFIAGIGWGLPHATDAARIAPWGPDELAPLSGMGELYRILVAGPPYSPQYPLLQYAVQAVFAAPYAAWLLVTGGMSGATGEYPFGLADPESALRAFTLTARLPSVLMGAGTVVAAWWTGERLAGRPAARAAALATMLSVPVVYYARTSNVDVPALFWLACGTYVFVRVLTDGLTTRRGLALGVLAALSIATKDAGYAWFGAMAPVLVAIQLGEAKRVGARAALRPLILGGVSAVAVYAVASGLVIGLDRFRAHVDFILHGTSLPEGVTGPFYFSGEASLAGYLRLAGRTARHVADSVGLPLALLAAAGLVAAARSRPRLLWLALPALGVFAGVILPVRFVLLRFALPIAYAAGLFAALAIARLWSAPGRVRLAARALAVVALAWAGLRALDLTAQMWTDARYPVGEWLARHLEAGDEVGYYGSTLKLPHLPADTPIGYMPGQRLPPDPGRPVADRPAVVLVIPQQEHEPVHEWTLLPEAYADLVDGSAGYRRVWTEGGEGWLGRRTITFVNPPVQVFVREDRLAEFPSP